jgi:hypothetical protein
MIRKLLLASLIALLMPLGSAQAGWRIGIGIGFPVYPWGGYYAPGPYYYGYYPPPVVVQQPAPVVVQQPAISSPAAQPTPQPTPPPTYHGPAPSLTPAAGYSADQSGNIGQALQLLSSPDERVRQNAAMDLGRMGADSAVEPLTAILTGDSSPAVRDAAARALGLIGASRALPALIRAAQGDNDRDVRHSAQFAVEVIRTNMRNR